MPRNGSGNAPLATVVPRHVNGFLTRDSRNNTQSIAEVQASFVAARFGLDAARAKLTAELCWRRS